MSVLIQVNDNGNYGNAYGVGSGFPFDNDESGLDSVE